ncbi:hypothetical protein COOONC_03838 [Cooperia oncophora]
MRTLMVPSYLYKVENARLRKLSIAFNNRDGTMNFRYLSAGPFRQVSSSNTHFVQVVTTRKKEMLEEGLRYCSSLCTKPETNDSTTRGKDDDVDDENEDLGEEIVIPSSKAVLDEDPLTKKDSFGFPLSIFTKCEFFLHHDNVGLSYVIYEPIILMQTRCSQGNLFHPYLSISYLDMIRSKSVRGFAIGATNALFVTKRDLIDAIVTIDEQI